MTIIIVTVMMSLTPGFVSSVSAARDTACDGAGKIDNKQFGTDIPVIFVHGFRGGKGDWGDTSTKDSFAYLIHAIDGVSVAHSFQYSSGFWVDHKDNGPKLAKVIDCIAQTSWKNGGKGKVIVIGYSMGGLVARDAIGRRSADNLRAIADEVGQVITIGTPHTGTTLPLATGFLLKTLLGAFTPGSPELTQLPHFPSQVAVHTIAGDVVRVYQDKNGKEIRRDQPHDDTLVTIGSATAEYSIGDAGGERIIVCEKYYRQQGAAWLNRFKESHGMASCEHQNLIKDAGNGVRDDVVATIKKYLAPAPKGMKDLVVAPVTFHLDQQWWSNIGSGTHANGTDGIASDLMSGMPCSGCGQSTMYATMYAINYSSYCSGTLTECSIYPQEVVGSMPAHSVGGKIPDIALRYADREYGGTGLMWCVTEMQVCVFYRHPWGIQTLLISTGFYEALRDATWND